MMLAHKILETVGQQDLIEKQTPCVDREESRCGLRDSGFCPNHDAAPKVTTSADRYETNPSSSIKNDHP